MLLRDVVEIWAVDVLTFTGLALHINYVSGLQGELIGLLGRVLIHTQPQAHRKKTQHDAHGFPGILDAYSSTDDQEVIITGESAAEQKHRWH